LLVNLAISIRILWRRKRRKLCERDKTLGEKSLQHIHVYIHDTYVPFSLYFSLSLHQLAPKTERIPCSYFLYSLNLHKFAFLSPPLFVVSSKLDFVISLSRPRRDSIEFKSIISTHKVSQTISAGLQMLRRKFVGRFVFKGSWIVSYVSR